MVQKEDIISWIEEVVKSEKLVSTKISIKSNENSTGGGYMGDFAFAQVAGTTVDGEAKQLNLAFKFGKNNDNLPDTRNLRGAYNKEAYVYETVVPTFRKFQEIRKVSEKFDGVAKCYGTLTREDGELIILEDLSVAGYKVLPSIIPMDDSHIKLVLKNYAQFHGISFALRDQQKDKFDEMVKDYSYMTFNTFFKQEPSEIFKCLATEGHKKIARIDPELAKICLEGFEEDMNNFFENIPEERVIVHADCWNNNFMFKYEEDQPVKAAILDWQLSNLHSPVADLSYFLYSVCSEKDLRRIPEFLKYYHDILSRNIKEMGSDPDKLFPYSTLLEHWKKYRVYGFAMLLGFMDILIRDKFGGNLIEIFSEMPNDEKSMMKVLLGYKKNENEVYLKRFIDMVRCYCEDK